MSVSIIQINQNDDLQEVIRKANTNFSTVANVAATTSTSSVITDDKSEAVARQLYSIQTSINQLRSWVQTQLSSMDTEIQELEQKIKDMVPKVGTYVLSDTNPSSQYPGTIWEKVTPAPIQNINTWKRTE